MIDVRSSHDILSPSPTPVVKGTKDNRRGMGATTPSSVGYYGHYRIPVSLSQRTAALGRLRDIPESAGEFLSNVTGQLRTRQGIVPPKSTVLGQ
jgi:hypothetical protein